MTIHYVYNQNIWANFSSSEMRENSVWSNEKVLPGWAGTWERPHAKWSVPLPEVGKGGSFCPQLAPGKPETCGDCLTQGLSPASVVGVRPQFQARGIVSRSSCPVTGGAVGICSLSLSPCPLTVYLEWLCRCKPGMPAPRQAALLAHLSSHCSESWVTRLLLGAGSIWERTTPRFMETRSFLVQWA